MHQLGELVSKTIQFNRLLVLILNKGKLKESNEVNELGRKKRGGIQRLATLALVLLIRRLVRLPLFLFLCI